MSESSFNADDDLTAGSTVDGEDSVNSAQADREAAFDDPTNSAAGNVTENDAVVADPPADSTVDESLDADGNQTSHGADIAAGYGDSAQDGD